MEDTNNKPIKDQQLQAVRFAAGVAVVIACLERAAVLSIFKQWHVWVFLTLNLLLIAILFTSANPPPKSDSGQESAGNCKSPPCTAAPAAAPEVDGGGGVVGNGVETGVDVEREEVGFEEERDGGGSGGDEGLAAAEVLTNEELNEKVEAFISRFRQQYLVSDVKISRRRSSGSDNVVCGNGVFTKTITV